ncbi:MAG: nucleotidyl transferase AbiEii/AbiGii toxin family protein [Parcubacteria group bacterium]|nr:nucleotidyl transferase AbiEii/AbiGii toxin family protein [Parcubacteria group bacterium]
MEKITILTPQQKKLLEFFAHSKLAKQYYLTGGTALAAFHLKHRLSQDLDFFAKTAAPLETVEKFCLDAAAKLGLKTPTLTRLYDRRIFIFPTETEELKVEFTEYPYDQLDPVTMTGGVNLDSIRDIAANKIMAIFDRFEPKDYVDLAVLLENFSLKNMIDDAHQKFGVRIEPISFGAKLMLVEKLPVMTKMLIPLTKAQIVRCITGETEKLKDQVLESLGHRGNK